MPTLGDVPNHESTPRALAKWTDWSCNYLGVLFLTRTFDVMSPRQCSENEVKLNSLWAVDIHDLFGFFI